MSKLTDHQLTAAIKASQATAAKHRAIGLDGNLILAKRAEDKAARNIAELNARGVSAAEPIQAPAPDEYDQRAPEEESQPGPIEITAAPVEAVPVEAKPGPVEVKAPTAPTARQLEPSNDVVIAAIVEMRDLIQRYSTTQCVRALHRAIAEHEETASAPSGFMDIADATRLQEMRKRHDAEAYHAQLERIAQHTRGKTGEDELESRRRQRPARRNKQ